MARTRTYRVDQKLIRVLRVMTDYLAVLIGFWYGYLLQHPLVRAGLLNPESVDRRPSAYVDLAMIFGLICVAGFSKLDLYRDRASILNLKELECAVKGVGLAAALFLAVLLLLGFSDYSRLVIIAGIVATVVIVVLERRFIAGMIRGLQLKGKIARRNVLIYGSGKTGVLVMKKLAQAPHKACRVAGFIDDFAPRKSAVRCRIDQSKPIVFEARVLGRLEDLKPLVKEHDVDELLVTVALTNAERHQELIELAHEAGVRVGVVPRFGELRADQLEVEDLSAVTVLRPSITRRRWLYPVFKRITDLGIASALLLMSIAVWPLIALAIKVESDGPVFFRQLRVGLDGRRFRIWKFRTMFAETQPYEYSPARDQDNRITRTGRILRMGGLDELPQLLNVILGHMSMVGPRPEMPFIADEYTAYERQRLTVKPGITGIWQLSCDRHAEIHENLEYDLYYIRHQSLLLDFLLLLETVFFTIDMVGGLARRRNDVSSEEGFRVVEDEPADLFDTQGYVVVALDQRRGDSIPESWKACAPILTMQLAVPVKVLTAADNIAFFDRLADEHRRSSDVQRVRDAMYIPYNDRSELRAMILEAKLVISDLPHVIQWARQGSVDALIVNGRAFKWVPRDTGAVSVIRDLAEFLSIDGEDSEIPHGDHESGFQHAFG